MGNLKEKILANVVLNYIVMFVTAFILTFALTVRESMHEHSTYKQNLHTLEVLYSKLELENDDPNYVIQIHNDISMLMSSIQEYEEKHL